MLTNDPAWTPQNTTETPPAAPGKHQIVVQTESHLDPPGTISKRPIYDFNNWSDDRVAVSDFNLFWNPGGQVTIKGGPAADDFARWRTLLGGKFDKNSVIADPLFVDPARRDYRLRPESPALKLGFRPIDTRSIGLKKDFPARLARE